MGKEKSMPRQIYQIQVVLNNTKPKIWRRLLVNSDTLLVDFHRIIQTTMGWTNSHLHRFYDGKTDYAPKEFEIEDCKNSRTIKLNTILKKEKSKILYEYDFGDGWNHDIILEKIIRDEVIEQIPRCIKGNGHCPPEDCGGPWGFNELLQVIANPKHEDYESMVEWIGEKFDPDYFDIEEINQNLKQKDYGCLWIE